MLLNNEMNVTFPEGFVIMNAAECSEMKMIKEGRGECIKDTDRHIVISMAWKKAGLFAAAAEPSDAIKKMEANIRKAQAPFDYQLDEFKKKDLGGRSAEGIRFHYVVQNTEMTSESYITKNGRTFYYLHFYGRTELKEESLAVWEEILNSISWA